jgi:hypothetical protein
MGTMPEAEQAKRPVFPAQWIRRHGIVAQFLMLQVI